MGAAESTPEEPKTNNLPSLLALPSAPGNVEELPPEIWDLIFEFKAKNYVLDEARADAIARFSRGQGKFKLATLCKLLFEEDSGFVKWLLKSSPTTQDIIP